MSPRQSWGEQWAQAGLRDPGRPGPQEILLFFTCALKQTQAPVYFLVDCILEDGGGFPTPAV